MALLEKHKSRSNRGVKIKLLSDKKKVKEEIQSLFAKVVFGRLGGLL